METHGSWYHSKRPFGANIPHQRTNSSTGKSVVLLVLGSKGDGSYGSQINQTVHYLLGYPLWVDCCHPTVGP
jgi:hypothetical protein